MQSRNLLHPLLTTLSALVLITLSGCSTTGGASTTGPSQTEIDECERRYKGSVAATEDTRADSPDRIVSNNDIRSPSSMSLGNTNNPCIPRGQQNTQAVSETDSIELAKDRVRLLLQQGKTKEAKLAMVLGFKKGMPSDTTLLPLTRQLQAQLQPQMMAARRTMSAQDGDTQGGCFFFPNEIQPAQGALVVPTPKIVIERVEDMRIECTIPRPLALKPEHTITLNIEQRLGDNNYTTVLSERVRKHIKRVGKADVIEYDWKVPKHPKDEHAYYRTYLSIEDGKSEAIHTSDSGFFWFK